jgi:hypothetical protein
MRCASFRVCLCRHWEQDLQELADLKEECDRSTTPNLQNADTRISRIRTCCLLRGVIFSHRLLCSEA